MLNEMATGRWLLGELELRLCRPTLEDVDEQLEGAGEAADGRGVYRRGKGIPAASTSATAATAPPPLRYPVRWPWPGRGSGSCRGPYLA